MDFKLFSIGYECSSSTICSFVKNNLSAPVFVPLTIENNSLIQINFSLISNTQEILTKGGSNDIPAVINSITSLYEYGCEFINSNLFLDRILCINSSVSR